MDANVLEMASAFINKDGTETVCTVTSAIQFDDYILIQYDCPDGSGEMSISILTLMAFVWSCTK